VRCPLETLSESPSGTCELPPVPGSGETPDIFEDPARALTPETPPIHCTECHSLGPMLQRFLPKGQESKSLEIRHILKDTSGVPSCYCHAHGKGQTTSSPFLTLLSVRRGTKSCSQLLGSGQQWLSCRKTASSKALRWRSACHLQATLPLGTAQSLDGAQDCDVNASQVYLPAPNWLFSTPAQS